MYYESIEWSRDFTRHSISKPQAVRVADSPASSQQRTVGDGGADAKAARLRRFSNGEPGTSATHPVRFGSVLRIAHLVCFHITQQRVPLIEIDASLLQMTLLVFFYVE